MKKLFLLIFVAILAACSPLSYDEVKSREEYCKGKGMTVEYLTISYDKEKYTRITDVFCRDDKGNRYNSEDIRKNPVTIFPAT